MSSNLRISKNILQIGESNVLKSKFMHALLESKSIFAIEQKAIVACFVKNVAFLLGHLVGIKNIPDVCSLLCLCCCFVAIFTD